MTFNDKCNPCNLCARLPLNLAENNTRTQPKMRNDFSMNDVVVVVQNEDDRSERGGIVRKKKGRDGRALLDVKKTGTQLLNRLLSNWEETIILIAVES